jgi:hypothetical protein
MTNQSISPTFSRRRWVRRVWAPFKIETMNRLIRAGKGAPWRLAGASVLNQKFSRDSSGWYADIPMWPGPRGACAMVCGADTLLDLLAGDQNRVKLKLAFEQKELPGKGVGGHLDQLRPDEFGDGADYECIMDESDPFELWLCGVTEFVFGHMPQRIYFEVV